MFDPDTKIERDLELLKNSITPSADLARRIRSVTAPSHSRYTIHHMIKYMFPVVAMAVVVFAVIGFKKHPSALVPSEPATGTSVVAGVEIDSIINSIVTHAQAEQSIANESDADVTLINSDTAQLDSFTTAYNANEY